MALFLAKYKSILLVLAGVIGLVLFMNVSSCSLKKTAKENGRLETKTQVQETVIEHVQEAKQAKEELSNRTSDVVKSDCMRWSRTPEKCQ